MVLKLIQNAKYNLYRCILYFKRHIQMVLSLYSLLHHYAIEDYRVVHIWVLAIHW